MRPHRTTAVVLGLLFPSAASAQIWEDVTSETVGVTAEWSNKVELADLDGDGRVDILFANGGNYNEPGTPEANRVFLNQSGGFVEATERVLGQTADTARVVKVRDVNGDGNPDIVVGTTYQNQSRLYLGDGTGSFDEVTDTHLPQMPLSVGDLEIGDVDGDGDMDIVLADWGPGDPFETAGAPVRLWLGDGSGAFEDATAAQMPTSQVQWSWDLELLDIDNDYDLDIAVSCKVCTGSKLYENDGSGTFSDVSDRLPQFSNNYEFEPIDINGDGFFDLLTINDGPQLSNQFDRPEHVFLGDGSGGFVDATDDVWPASANIGADDNAIVVFDFESDGDPDFLIASLGEASDRLLINDDGELSLMEATFGGNSTPGTLGIAVADLDGDGRLDVVQSQGELATDERVYFGTGNQVDSAAPIIAMVEEVSGEGSVVRARVHDNKTPVMAHDFESVTLTPEGGSPIEMTWYGGTLWRASADIAAGSSYEICATDAAGNRECVAAEAGSEPGEDEKTDDLGGEKSGCRTAPSSGGAVLALLALLALRRRRESRSS